MLRLTLFAFLLVSCSPEKKETASEVDIFAITEADIEYQMSEGSTREQAIMILEKKEAAVRAALKAGVNDDPVVRAAVARLLANRHRELVLQPKIKAELATLTDDRLREIYDQNIDKFQQPERRQVAVLWLDPGADPARKTAYLEKMQKARAFYLAHPENGFTALSIDHSQHAPSRYKGGVIGWLQQEGGGDAWSRAVAEIAFQNEDLSEVIDRKEGVFLVRVMKKKSARTQTFEAVRSRLKKEEARRLRHELEEAFEKSL